MYDFERGTHEKLVITFVFVCGLAVNIAEINSGYFGMGDSSLTFLIFFVFSFCKFKLKHKTIVSVATLLIYAVSMLPWWLTKYKPPVEKFQPSKRVQGVMVQFVFLLVIFIFFLVFFVFLVIFFGFSMVFFVFPVVFFVFFVVLFVLLMVLFCVCRAGYRKHKKNTFATQK